MRVKKYVVDALSDAVPLIRNDLGKDAVILESKEIKVGGFMGMFSKRKIEVMAAVEPNTAKAESKPMSKKMDTTDVDVDLVIEQILKASKRSKQQDIEESSSSAAAKVSDDHSKGGPSNEAAHSFASRLYGVGGVPASKPEAVSDDGSIGQVTNSAEHAKPSSSHVKEEALSKPSQELTVTEQFIVEELKSLRLEMIKLSKKGSEADYEPSEAINALKIRLQEQELDEQWIDLLVEQLVQLEEEAGIPLDVTQTWHLSKDKLMEWLSPYQQGSIASTSQIVQFVGPTGVGKTTTIAKLAANYSIKEGKKLGLITADTYRIAAVEQLRTYANILNLPLEVVFSPLELERALSALEHTELVMMDTAGRNFKSDLHVSEVNSLLPNNEQSESVLVLSLTGRTADMRIIAEKFSKYGVRKVVFTKLDETDVYGSIFNMVMMYGLTPLFITSGQNVPDDISPFQVDKYIELLLGDLHDA